MKLLKTFTRYQQLFGEMAKVLHYWKTFCVLLFKSNRNTVKEEKSRTRSLHLSNLHASTQHLDRHIFLGCGMKTVEEFKIRRHLHSNEFNFVNLWSLEIYPYPLVHLSPNGFT